MPTPVPPSGPSVKAAARHAAAERRARHRSDSYFHKPAPPGVLSSSRAMLASAVAALPSPPATGQRILGVLFTATTPAASAWKCAEVILVGRGTGRMRDDSAHDNDDDDERDPDDDGQTPDLAAAPPADHRRTPRHIFPADSPQFAALLAALTLAECVGVHPISANLMPFYQSVPIARYEFASGNVSFA